MGSHFRFRPIFVIIATPLFTMDYTTEFSRVELVPVIPIGDFVVSNAPSTGSGLLHFKNCRNSSTWANSFRQFLKRHKKIKVFVHDLITL